MGLGQECGRAYKKQWRKPTSTRYSLRSRSDVQSSSDLLLPIVQVPMLLLPLMAIIYRVPLDTQILHPLLLSTPHVLATQPLPASPIVEFQLRAKAKDHAHMVQVGTGVNVRTRNVLRTTHLNRVNANHVNPLAGNNGEGSSSHNEGCCYRRCNLLMLKDVLTITTWCGFVFCELWFTNTCIVATQPHLDCGCSHGGCSLWFPHL